MEYRGPKSIFRMVISKHPRASNRNTRARASSHPMSLFLLPSSPLCPLSSTDHSTIFQVLVWSARRYSMYFFGGVKTRYLEYEIEMTEGTLAAQFRILSTRGWLYIYICIFVYTRVHIHTYWHASKWTCGWMLGVLWGRKKRRCLNPECERERERGYNHPGVDWMD